MQRAEDALAGLELLREELLELELHLQQVGRGAAAHEDLQLVPGQLAVRQDYRRPGGNNLKSRKALMKFYSNNFFKSIN